MYVFLIYVCLQKHCLRLICLSSIAYVSDYISDMNHKRFVIPSLLTRFDLFCFLANSDVAHQHARYPRHEFHDVIRVAPD